MSYPTDGKISAPMQAYSIADLTSEIMRLKKIEARFQLTCSHKYGEQYNGASPPRCANCGWDLSKCQHKDSLERTDNYCGECGESLKKGEQS